MGNKIKKSMPPPIVDDRKNWSPFMIDMHEKYGLESLKCLGDWEKMRFPKQGTFDIETLRELEQSLKIAEMKMKRKKYVKTDKLRRSDFHKEILALWMQEAKFRQTLKIAQDIVSVPAHENARYSQNLSLCPLQASPRIAAVHSCPPMPAAPSTTDVPATFNNQDNAPGVTRACDISNTTDKTVVDEIESRSVEGNEDSSLQYSSCIDIFKPVLADRDNTNIPVYNAGSGLQTRPPSGQKITPTDMQKADHYRGGDSRRIVDHHRQYNNGLCFICNGNHWRSDCPQLLKKRNGKGAGRTKKDYYRPPQQGNRGLDWNSGACFNCNSSTHWRSNCPLPRRPKGLIGAKLFLMTLKHIDQNDEEDDSGHFGWRGVAGEDHGNARHASGHLSGETQISHLATQNRPKKVQVK